MKKDSVVIEIKGVGPVLFERSKRAKHIIISVKSDGRVRVAVPVRASVEKALQFAISKTDWIVRHRESMRLKEIERKRRARQLPDINKAEAKRLLIRRIGQLADTYGFTFNRVTVRNQKTRWGSCSAKNNISLSMKLVLLPEALRDYVILHELVHTRVHNHSSQFWQELDRYVGSGKVMAKKLKEYGHGLLD